MGIIRVDVLRLTRSELIFGGNRGKEVRFGIRWNRREEKNM